MLHKRSNITTLFVEHHNFEKLMNFTHGIRANIVKVNHNTQYCGTKVKINGRYSWKQNWVRQKTSKKINVTKFAGTEKCIHILSHA